MKKLSIFAISAALLFSSCETSDQFGAAAGGGILGGIFGSAIGGLMGGHRGADAGAAIGIIAGAAMGAASAAPKERGTSDYDYTTDTYNRHSKVVYSSRGEDADRMGREFAKVEIQNLRFVDRNNNQAIDAGENSKIVFEVKNNGSHTIYDIAPIISVRGTKHIIISPTAVISYIDAGQAVRYTAEVYGKRQLRNGVAEFTISFAKGDYLYNMTSFQLATRGRK
ncbi:MAG: hypothetical protein J6W50_00630 [Bacteroidaceae bacterium]|nr:hypothetical protein [Bacteroidaceae bacterium]MBP5731203.1 hypothetical protein [Bacteroidaceae bacterium]